MLRSRFSVATSTRNHTRVRNMKGIRIGGRGKGGSVAWQLYDERGNPTSEKGRAEGVPTWSLVAAVTKPDGNFVIIY